MFRLFAIFCQRDGARLGETWPGVTGLEETGRDKACEWMSYENLRGNPEKHQPAFVQPLLCPGGAEER